MVKIFRSSYQFSGNVYVIYSEKGTILIDPGYHDSGIKKYLKGKKQSGLSICDWCIAVKKETEQWKMAGGQYLPCPAASRGSVMHDGREVL